jgi:hypothetical protein
MSVQFAYKQPVMPRNHLRSKKTAGAVASKVTGTLDLGIEYV